MGGNKKIITHVLLFLITLYTTSLAGANLISIYRKGWTETDLLLNGFSFSIPFLAILTVHEFGHYFTALYHRVKVTLPYYIPFYIPGLFSIGTLGAFIQIKQRLRTTIQVFDIGYAGPVAGFILAMFVLIYGFTNLPEKNYVFQIHEYYEKFGEHYEDSVYTYQSLVAQAAEEHRQYQLADSAAFPEYKKSWIYQLGKSMGWETREKWERTPFVASEKYEVMSLGNNLLMILLEKFVADPERLPVHFEMMHYPLLLAGYLALFFTALNLMPIGQLDGGHIIFGLFGPQLHEKISRVFFIAFIFFAGSGIFNAEIVTDFIPLATFDNTIQFGMIYLFLLYILFNRVYPERLTNLFIATIVFTAQFLVSFFFPHYQGFPGWLLFGFILGRVIGIYHPPVFKEQKLDTKRKIIGWICILIFILCFTPEPLKIVEFAKP